jgi:hypothetical protein
MINDIFATSMHGRYTTSANGTIVETGEWTYRGYGNAEITMSATADRADANLRYELRLHSVERQLDEIFFRPHGEAGPRPFHARIAGHIVSINEPDGEALLGNLNVPPETVYDGPSPIWLVHLVMTAPPPTDREITTPVVRLSLDDGEFHGGFYRLERSGNNIAVSKLDKEGVALGSMSVILAEDGCPRRVVTDGSETEIVRLPTL